MPPSLMHFLRGSTCAGLGGQLNSQTGSVILFLMARAVAGAVMNGREISVCFSPSSSRPSLPPRRALLARVSLLRSIPCSFELLDKVGEQDLVEVLPPRTVNPRLLFTSNTPSRVSSTETSKVPPPGLMGSACHQPCPCRGGTQR